MDPSLTKYLQDTYKYIQISGQWLPSHVSHVSHVSHHPPTSCSTAKATTLTMTRPEPVMERLSGISLMRTATVVGGMSLSDLVREKCPTIPVRPTRHSRSQVVTSTAETSNIILFFSSKPVQM